MERSHKPFADRFPTISSILEPEVIVKYFLGWIVEHKASPREARDELHRYLVRRMEEEGVPREELLDAVAETTGSQIMKTLIEQVEKRLREGNN